MYRQHSLLFVLPLLITFAFLYVYSDTATSKSAGNKNQSLSVNRVIGDESYIQTFGSKPDKTVPDHIRIKTHLQYVESLLRNRSTDHLSDELKNHRATHLDHLREYIQIGDFPHNDGHADKRRPTFISDDGNICAVGYLVEKDLGHTAVESINKKYKYDYITDINDPVFLKWADSSGFTLRELAMIQPAYGPEIIEEVKRNKNDINLSYGIGSAFLAGANILYHTNNPQHPWLFDDASSNYWFGIAAGSGSILMGVLNLDNTKTYREPIKLNYDDACPGMYCPPLREVTQTNHIRTVLSIANMGVGLFTVLRAGYHLVKKTDDFSSPKTTSIGVALLEPNPIETDVSVPAVQMHVRF